MIIYRATSPSGKQYIGKTIQSLNERKRNHYNESFLKKSSKGYNTKFHRAIRKYGLDSFKWEILHENIVCEIELSKLEELEILNTLKGHAVSKETLEKMSTAKLGSKRSEEVKRKISETMKRKGLNPQLYKKEVNI